MQQHDAERYGMPKHRAHGKQNVRPLISRIEIEKLFHTYSYVLDIPDTSNTESARLMLLYGNNGSGKTTILNLLYHLLDPEPYGGHRSYVGSVPFKTFRVYLVNGVVVTASRSQDHDAGPYNLSIELPNNKNAVTWKWFPRGERRAVDDPGKEKYGKVCSTLRDLGLSFHYLRDTRRVEGKISSLPPVIARRDVVEDEPFAFFAPGHAEQEVFSPDQQLENSVQAVILWFREHALSATNVGYTSVDTIYRDLIKEIVKPRKSQKDPQLTDPDELIQELIGLKEKNSEFARFGLTPELNVRDLVTNIKSAKPRHIPMLNTVLRPYLEGHAARLDALDELQTVMSSFISLLSKFYSHKKLSVHIQQGLNITADIGQDLETAALSSGEKQLLLLFCNAISSRQDKTILMIDEPEISLNVRWQRELIPALLTCMSGTAFQLILATHSVELIAQYRDCVIALDNVDEAAIHE